MKTVLLGMNNADPDKAFDPYKSNASGERLVKMINEYATAHDRPAITKEQFADGFERDNILHKNYWDLKEARKKRWEILEKYKNRKIIVFGDQTRQALEYSKHRPEGWVADMNNMILIKFLPHPSGRCFDYNVKDFRILVGGILYRQLEIWSSANAESD
jgi:hypothetical protein